VATERKTIMELQTGNVKIKTIGPIQDVGSNGFQKRDVDVITEEAQYPQTLRFQFDGSHINKPDSLKVGDIVNISFNLKGREWVNPQGETVVFNTLQGWKISSVTSAESEAPAAQNTPQATAQPAAQNQAPAASFTEEEDDLPF